MAAAETNVELGLLEPRIGGAIIQAVGTGLNTHPESARRVCRRVSAITGLPVHETDNHFQAQSTLDAVVQAHGGLNSLAVSLTKIANDIRWMGSGPRAGVGEVSIPEVQPGSSIMPGKVTPVIAEALVPAIGYDEATETAKEPARTGRTIRSVARRRTALSDEELDRSLDPVRMTQPGSPPKLGEDPS